MQNATSTFYIYHPETFELYRGSGYYPKTYKSYRAVRSQLTRLVNKGAISADWRIISVHAFNKIEPMVEVTSMMSGQPVLIRKRDVGSCTDPSTEQYWSM